MKPMTHRFSTIIHKEGSYYVAQAIELGVASQGRTLAEAKSSLAEAVELYLEDQDPSAIPQGGEKPILTSIEVQGGKKAALR